jgi:methionyl-tRNA synthetase
LIGENKMGKSLGNAVDPIALLDRYGVDPVRYYLLREVPFGADGHYTEDALVLRTNVDLANDLGNLLSRTTAMINRFWDGRLPPCEERYDDRVLATEAEQVYHEVADAMEQLAISDALSAIFRLVRTANKYIEDKKPWDLAKAPDRRAELGTVLYGLAETLRILSVLLTPFLLETPGKIRTQLGIDEPVRQYDQARYGQLPVGRPIRRQTPLFPRIEREAPASQAPLTASDARAVSANEVSIEEFQRLDLRVATVRVAEVIAGADRLLKLTVFDGERERTIVSGIREHYQPHALVGQQVVVVANLKPVKIRGVLSEGMLLAGSINGRLSLVAPKDWLPEGAPVK